MVSPAMIAAGVGLAGSIFGKKPKTPATGFYALPAPVQQTYLNQLLPGAQGAFQQSQTLTPEQQKALQSLGIGGADLTAEIGQYMNPYTDMVTNRVLEGIRRQGDTAQSANIARRNMTGARNFQDSSLYEQQGAIEGEVARATADALANLNYQNFNNAANLRQQTLGNMLFAGEYPVNYQFQNLGNLASILGQFQGGTPAQRQGGGLGNMLSGLGLAVGSLGPKGNTGFDQLGGLLSNLFNPQQSVQSRWLNPDLNRFV